MKGIKFPYTREGEGKKSSTEEGESYPRGVKGIYAGEGSQASYLSEGTSKEGETLEDPVRSNGRLICCERPLQLRREKRCKEGPRSQGKRTRRKPLVSKNGGDASP